MSLDVFTIIVGILALLFAGLIFGLSLKLAKGLIGMITVAILFIVGIVIIFLVLFTFRNSITSDYRSVDTIDTYKIYNISFEDETTVVHYLDENKEIKHVKSGKAKMYYDLAGEKEPYVVKKRYWRWFIYWDELELHLDQ